MTVLIPEDEHYGGRLDLRLWRRILEHARPYRGCLVGLGASGAVLAAIDALTPLVTGLIIDEASTAGMSPRLVRFGLFYALLMAGFSLCVWGFIELAGRVATGVACDLRTRGFGRLQELSFSYYDTRPVGWLVTRLTSDVSKLSSLIPWFMLDLVWGTCCLAGIAAGMFWLDWRLALVVITIVPPLVLVSMIFQRKLLESSREIRRTNAQITAQFNEAIGGVRTTKTLAREDANLVDFQGFSGSMEGHSVRNALQSAVYLPIVITIGSLGIGLALWRGGAMIALEGTGLTLGTLVAFMQYAALFSMPVQELARRFTELQSAQAAAERVQDLLDTVPEIRDAPEVAAAVAARRGIDDDRAEDGGPRAIETIEFRDVTFWYKPGEPVLEHFDLTVHAGETIALVGPTGGGKSTIVSLAARFYEPCTGAVLVNGTDLRARSLHWLQSNLGAVLQTPHLFSGTIGDNIRYGRLDADDAAVADAARLAGAHGFIADLEQGYDTPIGEGGTMLSTGQRQLVALARAVLADPQVFLMDEATSSVDAETELLIQAGIDAVLRGRIAFVIAHRLSTIRSADRILLIDGGRIVEQGTHEALMATRSRYRALYLKQFARERTLHGT